MQDPIHDLLEDWAGRLGCTLAEMRTPGLNVTAANQWTEGESGLVLLANQGGSTTLSVCDDVAEEVVAAARRLEESQGILFAEDLAGELGEERCELFSRDQVWLALPEWTHDKPVPEGYALRELDAGDADALAALLEACDEDDREIVTIEAGQPILLGLFEGDDLRCAASVVYWSERLADASVITHPDHWIKGLAKAALSELTKRVEAGGRYLQYRCAEDDQAAVRLGRSLNLSVVLTVELLDVSP